MLGFIKVFQHLIVVTMPEFSEAHSPEIAAGGFHCMAL